MAEKTYYLLKCIDSGADFFTVGERDFYFSKGLKTPKRCKSCRDKKKARYGQIQKEKELQALLSTLPFQRALDLRGAGNGQVD